eukprot:6178070-Prymnesium_polylepis.1
MQEAEREAQREAEQEVQREAQRSCAEPRSCGAERASVKQLSGWHRSRSVRCSRACLRWR